MGKKKSVKDPFGFGTGRYYEIDNRGKTTYTDFFGQKTGSREKHWLTGDTVIRDSSGKTVKSYSLHKPSHYESTRIADSVNRSHSPRTSNYYEDYGIRPLSGGFRGSHEVANSLDNPQYKIIGSILLLFGLFLCGIMGNISSKTTVTTTNSVPQPPPLTASQQLKQAFGNSVNDVNPQNSNLLSSPSAASSDYNSALVNQNLLLLHGGGSGNPWAASNSDYAKVAEKVANYYNPPVTDAYSNNCAAISSLIGMIRWKEYLPESKGMATREVEAKYWADGSGLAGEYRFTDSYHGYGVNIPSQSYTGKIYAVWIDSKDGYQTLEAVLIGIPHED